VCRLHSATGTRLGSASPEALHLVVLFRESGHTAGSSGRVQLVAVRRPKAQEVKTFAISASPIRACHRLIQSSVAARQRMPMKDEAVFS
jgi:hypothetical protein